MHTRHLWGVPPNPPKMEKCPKSGKCEMRYHSSKLRIFFGPPLCPSSQLGWLVGGIQANS